MYPMDMEEYLRANGDQKSTVQYLKDCYENGRPDTDAIQPLGFSSMLQTSSGAISMAPEEVVLVYFV